MALRRKNKSDFKPDATRNTLLKTMRMTQLQRLRLLKWAAYVFILIMAVVIQDVILSQLRLLGASVELVVCVILLITVMEGTEVGSVFVLLASVGYFYSGTAPGAYAIGLLCFLGIFVTLARQMYLHRSKGAIILCAGAAAALYEVCVFAVGIFQGLTRWDKLPVFLISGIYNLLMMIPLYPLVYKTGLIGGNTWKE